MQSFLQEGAADLYRRYGEDVSSLHILFPTRRARHFFIDALSHLAERPMWQPRWLTIDDLASAWVRSTVRKERARKRQIVRTVPAFG